MIRAWGRGISIAIGADGKPFAIVCIDAASFVRHGAEVLRRYPVTTLDVGNVGAHAADLVALPAVQRMRRLVLHELGDAGAAVVGGARLAVRELVAVGCGLTRVDRLQPLAAQLDVLELLKVAPLHTHRSGRTTRRVDAVGPDAGAGSAGTNARLAGQRRVVEKVGQRSDGQRRHDPTDADQANAADPDGGTLTDQQQAVNAHHEVVDPKIPQAPQPAVEPDGLPPLKDDPKGPGPASF